MTPMFAGAAVGLMGGAGVLVAIAASPSLRRPRLADRLAPYLRDSPRPSRLLEAGGRAAALPVLDRLLGPVLHDAARRLDSFIGGTASVRRRLEQAGTAATVEQFRMEQLLWGVAGLLLGVLAAVATAASGSTVRPMAFVLLALVPALVGVFGRDRALTMAAASRERRMLAEFPTVAELLALAVSAGESPVAAMERVARLVERGELAAEFEHALAHARSGVPLVAALDRMATRTALPTLARFVDGMTVAIDRGTPLADVLRAQAVDVREEGRRRLLETAGRKEIAMLLPVVFFVLPVTVVFALFPGFYNLSLSVP